MGGRVSTKDLKVYNFYPYGIHFTKKTTKK